MATCLRTVVATASLKKNKQANKLTLGHDLILTAPRVVKALLQVTPEHWLSNIGMTQYQALLLDYLQAQFENPSTISPAILLPDDDPTGARHEPCCQSCPVLLIAGIWSPSSITSVPTFCC